MKLIDFVKLEILSLKPNYGSRLTIGFIISIIVLRLVLEIFLNIHVPFFYLMLAGMLLLMLGSLPFTNEERNDINSFYITQNISRDTVVKGRFLFNIMISFLVVVFCVIFDILVLIIAGKLNEIATVFIIALLLYLGNMIYNAFALPVFFKLGFLKGRILAMFTPIILMCICAFGIIIVLPDFTMPSSLDLGLGLIIIGVAVFAVIASYFSILLSMKFYSKREF